MFTGIVEGVGRIERVEPLGADAGVRLTVDAGRVSLADAKVGDSIAVNGACMTITSLSGQRFTVDVSRESLTKTVGLDAPGEVNLETALALGEALGGHLVSGHVDGVGEVVRFAPVGESWELVVRAPQELAKYFAYKGSVAIDGVSLTVNRVTDTAAGCELSINLIPHTIEVTTLKRLAPGARVNLEVDLIARYVERMLAATTAAGA
ncbi:MAG: riboflavin synthase [Burkholderiaceae bacterium]